MKGQKTQASHNSRLTDIEVIRALSRQYGLQPSKKFSQNFLLDETVLDVMLETSRPKKGEWVIEVGPGFGVLTERLLASGADVTSIEIDERLAAALVSRFKSHANFQIVIGDFLAWFHKNQSALSKRQFRIIANLPYAMTSHFFATVLDSAVQPVDITVLIQKEVAERIAAKPGDMSMLGVSVQYFGVPEYIATVPRAAFWPVPNVDSAILHVSGIHPERKDKQEVFRLAKMAFAGKRKQIHNTLKAGLRCSDAEIDAILAAAKIPATVRPQELRVADWQMLAEAVATR